jgi:putative chitinase
MNTKLNFIFKYIGDIKMEELTLLKLKSIINNKYITNDLILALNQTFVKYEINTKLRQIHFLAQIIHESGSFKYVQEIASGEAYEGRKDLGNYNKGDGVKYKGRGLIQITGRNNYTELSKAFGTNFIDNPILLETYPHAALSAGWYWDSRKLNIFADKDDIITITRKINGGLNGIDDRKKWLQILRDVFN